VNDKGYEVEGEKDNDGQKEAILVHGISNFRGLKLKQ
jgi:hypothetical protein